jgi:hypothetical protein
MIQTKELRFGNKVYNPRNAEIITVQQILHSTIIYDTQLKISKERTNSNGMSSIVIYKSEVVEVIKEVEYHDLDPIILTPQILLKCGFRNFIRDEWIVSHSNGHADFDFTAEGLRLRHPTPSRLPIKYLHQLQNFYFALTGEELEVNL